MLLWEAASAALKQVLEGSLYRVVSQSWAHVQLDR
jgi:hypothetical protein